GSSRWWEALLEMELTSLCKNYKRGNGSGPFLRTGTHPTKPNIFGQNAENSRLSFPGAQSASASWKGGNYEQGTLRQDGAVRRVSATTGTMPIEFGNLERAARGDFEFAHD